MPSGKPFVQTRISPSAEEILKERCEARGLSVASYLRELIYKDLQIYPLPKKKRG